jgi:DNA mismatch endonuclease (patch repair protein)
MASRRKGGERAGNHDVFSKSKRSQIMSRVRSRGNAATELRLIELLRKFGIKGWRRNSRIFGSPDFVLPQSKVAVFVDGCFWHSCPQHASSPKTNAEFWRAKLERNRLRDALVSRTLRKEGWKVVRLWQHELRDEGATRKKLRAALARAQARSHGTGNSAPGPK